MNALNTLTIISCPQRFSFLMLTHLFTAAMALAHCPFKHPNHEITGFKPKKAVLESGFGDR